MIGGDRAKCIATRKVLVPPRFVVANRLNFDRLMIVADANFEIDVEIGEVWARQATLAIGRPHFSKAPLERAHKRRRVEQDARVATGSEALAIGSAQCWVPTECNRSVDIAGWVGADQLGQP